MRACPQVPSTILGTTSDLRVLVYFADLDAEREAQYQNIYIL